MSAPEFPPIRELMAHRDPVILLDCVLVHDAASTSVLVSTAKQQWLRRKDGSVASWLALEYMAQGIAAHEGLRALAEGRPLPVGFLVSAKGLRFYCASFAPDERLRVGVRRVRGRPGLGVIAHQCTLHGEAAEARGPLLAEGRLTVSVPPQLQKARAS
jgi:predicted hotdog family 3-hydroxylacyl-ACP dehydratase